MPSQPIPFDNMDERTASHTDEQAERAALAALGVLEQPELGEFELHLASCQHCQTILAQDRQTVARLSAVAPEMEPAGDFKDRLLRRAREEMTRAPAGD